MRRIKAGIKTSEFWLALVGSIIPVMNKHLELNIPIEGILSIMAIIISYILGRSIVKKEEI